MEQKITALKVQKRNSARVNVYLDDQFAFGLSRIVGSWLKIGQELSADKIIELKNSDSQETAYQKALRFISYKPRTTHQVIQRLKKHKISDELIDLVIDKLNDIEYLNDRQFSENWVENRSTYKPRSGRMIQAELRQKGVSQKIISEVISTIDENENAIKAANKQARKYRRLSGQDFRKKMIAFLSRKGFHYGTISEIIPQVIKQHQAETLEQD